MSLKNNKGSTLIENVISVFLLAIFSLMVFSSLSIAINALKDAYVLDNQIIDDFKMIEEDRGIVGENPDVNSISFEINGTSYTIDGDYKYGSNKLLGEFVGETDDE